jgi:putative FmdB family regulatory protein
MPIYEYRCADCKRRVSLFSTDVSSAGRSTPSAARNCGSVTLSRLVSRVFQLKGEDAQLEDMADPCVWCIDESDPEERGALGAQARSNRWARTWRRLGEMVDRPRRAGGSGRTGSAKALATAMPMGSEFGPTRGRGRGASRKSTGIGSVVHDAAPQTASSMARPRRPAAVGQAANRKAWVRACALQMPRPQKRHTPSAVAPQTQQCTLRKALQSSAAAVPARRSASGRWDRERRPAGGGRGRGSPCRFPAGLAWPSGCGGRSGRRPVPQVAAARSVTGRRPQGFDQDHRVGLVEPSAA